MRLSWRQAGSGWRSEGNGLRQLKPRPGGL